MSVGKNRERGLDVEDVACERFPCEPVPEDRDQRNGWFDVIFTDEIPGVVDENDVGESKSCYPDYSDRAGRWKIVRGNHEKLVDAGGVYILSVVERETEKVLRMAIVDASTIDVLIDGNWWDAGNGGRRRDAEFRQIPWTQVFHGLQEGES